MLTKIFTAFCTMVLMLNGFLFPFTASAQQALLAKNKATTPIEELKQNMVHVQGATFTMGCTADQQIGDYCYASEHPAHQVTISSFSMCRYLVTQALWKAVMGNNPSGFKGCDNCPVENVSWLDAQQFISKLNQLTGEKYRLATEAEWEYAARGGNNSKNCRYPGSNDINVVAWYVKNSGDKTHPVGLKQANELGLCDMAGNVMEWCADWYDDYGSAAAINPKGPDSGQYRILRGSSWLGNPQNCHPSDRDSNVPERRDNIIGFRIVKN